jgi:putative endonuclease
MTFGPGGFKHERQARNRRGHLCEIIAAALLTAKGYRILARRYRSPAGEVDLVACRGRRLTFVEVKRRTSLEACEAAISAEQSRRIRRAADYWLSRHPRHRDYEIVFDAMFFAAGRWPRHVRDGL